MFTSNFICRCYLLLPSLLLKGFLKLTHDLVNSIPMGGICNGVEFVYAEKELGLGLNLVVQA